MQNLGLDPVVASNSKKIGPTAQSASKKGLYLHDIENSLANLAASTFWIGKSHIFN
jgi:hypothetical protein